MNQTFVTLLKILMIIFIAGVAISLIYCIFNYVSIDHSATDTYDDWDCLRNCYNANNLSSKLHSNYEFCSDECIEGRYHDKRKNQMG